MKSIDMTGEKFGRLVVGKSDRKGADGQREQYNESI